MTSNFTIFPKLKNLTGITSCLLCLSFTAYTSSAANASEAALTEFHKSAYTGTFKRGIERLEKISTADPDDTDAIFAKGTLQFFLSLANLQEGFYRHNVDMGSSNDRTLRDLRMLLPIPSMPNTAAILPTNPTAQPMTYQALRKILATFVDDLIAAEATLKLVGDRPTKLPFNPFKIAIDLNHDETISPGESLMGVMLNFGSARGFRGSRQNGSRMKALRNTTIAFDTADASWLRGYSHLLMATANLMLAFDFEKSYDTIAHNYYGNSATKFGQQLERERPPARAQNLIQAELDELRIKIKEIAAPNKKYSAQLKVLQKQLRVLKRTRENAEERKLLIEARRTINKKKAKFYTERNKLRREQSRLKNELSGRLPRDQYAQIFDIVAYIHSLNWQVVDPARFKSVRTHLLQVSTINQTTWGLVRAETDNDHEWLPNPGQDSPFGARRLTDEIIDSWIKTMNLSAEVLNGELLLPHPRFSKGINLKTFFETAKEVDIVLLITGHGAIPYLEDGKIADMKAWEAVTGPLGSDLPIFAIWFN